MLFIGLISGTSIDGIDAALVDFSHDEIKLLDSFYYPYSIEIRAKIYSISQADQTIALNDYGQLDSEIGILFAEAANALLEQSQIPKKQVRAIGSHGQTVFHAPNAKFGFSLQLGDPNRIAQLTGIKTIADFRRADIAVGGQGAPLVPAFHQAAFKSSIPRTIVNIGGIANITALVDNNVQIGFDTGPGNTLMDLWIAQNLGQTYDNNGAWAASGSVNPILLASLKEDEYFKLKPPKSTGTDYFSYAWLEKKLAPFSTLLACDIQATLCQFTADTITSSISDYAKQTAELLICGGGAHNQHLLELLRQNLNLPVNSTAKLGINPDYVEACAFAWLAKQRIDHCPLNLSHITGASRPVMLGGIYLAD